ncbi:hypothetical protein BH23GEM6_BH23GEM6_00080 [soil metagenome]
MRHIMVVVLMFAVSSVAGAQEAAFGAAENPTVSVRETPAPAVVSSAPAVQEVTTEMRPVQAERSSSEEGAAVLPTQRGSFWWFVAVLVVAAVIVSVVLN